VPSADDDLGCSKNVRRRPSRLVIVGVALMIGAGVAVWQSHLPTVYQGAAHIPVRNQLSTASLRDALEGSTREELSVDARAFHITPSHADRELLQRTRGVGTRAPEFIDSDRETAFLKFRPASRQIRVEAYGASPEEALDEAYGYARRWVTLRSRRLARLLESVATSLELEAAVGATSGVEARVAMDLTARIRQTELARLDERGISGKGASLTSPRPVRDGVVTAAAIVIVAGLASTARRWRRRPLSE